MSTFEIVKEVISENLGIEEERITEDATLESLGVDSLDMVELVCDIEDRCDIEFGEPEGLTTIGEMVAHIEACK